MLQISLDSYASEDAAFDHRDTVQRLVQERIRQETTEHWLALLSTKDLWCARVQDFDDLMVDPQVAHNDLIQTIEHPTAGTIKVIGMPVQFSETPGTIRLVPPRVGEHTDAVLAEIGFTSEQIQALHREGII